MLLKYQISDTGYYITESEEGDLRFAQFSKGSFLFLTFNRLTWSAEVTGEALRGMNPETPLYDERYAQTASQGDCRFVFGVSAEERFVKLGSSRDNQLAPTGSGYYVYTYLY